VKKNMGSTGNKWYDWFLWITGFWEDEDDDDTISDMLRRQKERMGWVWWLGALGTIILTGTIWVLQIWLFFHIIYSKAREVARGLFR
jgi:hypothetical protein